MIIFSIWNTQRWPLVFLLISTLVNFSAVQVSVGLEVHTQKCVRMYVDVMSFALSFLISIWILAIFSIKPQFHFQRPKSCWNSDGFGYWQVSSGNSWLYSFRSYSPNCTSFRVAEVSKWLAELAKVTGSLTTTANSLMCPLKLISFKLLYQSSNGGTSKIYLFSAGTDSNFQQMEVVGNKLQITGAGIAFYLVL